MYVSKKLSYCSIVLIGPLLTGFKTELFKELDNVHILGLKKYQFLPAYMKYFDICLIPYVIKSEWNDSADSTKMYDYLISGKPVVATPTAGVDRFPKVKPDLLLA